MTQEETRRPIEEWTDQELNAYIFSNGEIVPKKNEIEQFYDAMCMISQFGISFNNKEQL